jgi:broad-specificity NMP kinase
VNKTKTFVYDICDSMDRVTTDVFTMDDIINENFKYSDSDHDHDVEITEEILIELLNNCIREKKYILATIYLYVLDTIKFDTNNNKYYLYKNTWY